MLIGFRLRERVAPERVGGEKERKDGPGFGIPAERWMQMSPEVWESHYLSAQELFFLGRGCLLLPFAALCCLLLLSLFFFFPCRFFFFFFFFMAVSRPAASFTRFPGILLNRVERVGRASNISQSSTSFSFPSGPSRQSEPKEKKERKKKKKKNHKTGEMFPRGQVRILYLLCRTGHAEWRYVTDRMCACTARE